MRTSLNSQIPAMAVEMPGSTDISGLNLQFGALQFGSEPVLPEYDSTPAGAGATTAPANQVQNSLYTSPSRFVYSRGEEHSFERKLHEKQTLTFSLFQIRIDSTAALSHCSQMDLYDQRPPQTRRYPPSVSSSPQKDVQPKVKSHGRS